MKTTSTFLGMILCSSVFAQTGQQYPNLALSNSIQQTFETSVAVPSDDAEEKFNNAYVTVSSSDLELDYDTWNDQGNQTIGVRFTDINIPSNATINSAYIQFTAKGSSSGDVTLSIFGEKSAVAETFDDNVGNSISSRTKTTNNVTWDAIPNWGSNDNGEGQRTPNLATIVSEIITNNNWQSGNPLAFIITGNGTADQVRRAYSYDGSSSKAPKLVINYTINSTTDLALSEITSPSSEIIGANADYQLAVNITNFGSQTAENYTVKCYIDNVLHQSQASTAPLAQGATTNFVFSQTADFSEAGSHEISFEVEILGDENQVNNKKNITVQVIQEVTDIFFNQDSMWRYWDNSSSPGDDWINASFDDSSWAVGSGKMGFGVGSMDVNLNTGNARYCFRKKVTISDYDTLGDKVFFHVKHDDGAVIYINGEEAFRTELMPYSTIGHNTTTYQKINSDLSDKFITYAIDKSYFVAGENQIAISVHNVSAGDDDLSFSCFTTPTHEYSQDGPYIIYEGGNIVVKEVTPTGVVSNTYTSVEGVEFTCHLPNWDNKSFSFTLQPNLTIDPSVIEETPTKFLVISDFDNHIEAFSKVLLGEGIMDENFNWTYGNGHLVISGDLFDRGVNVTECLWLLYKLETEAVAQGGRVHLVIGNHEMMNIIGDYRYVEEKYFTNAQAIGVTLYDMYGPNTEIGRWLRTKNIILKLGDYAIMHGGISPQVANLGLTYEQMNNYGRDRMNGLPCNGDCATVNGGSSVGIYWYRGMAKGHLTQEQVDDIIDTMGVKRIIFGHTKGNTVRSLYNGKVFAIDMYHMDNFSQGYMEALKYNLGCFYIFHTSDTETTYTQIGECDAVAGIDNAENVGFSIYPNPTSQYIYVTLPEMMKGENKYNIYNSLGQEVLGGILDIDNNRMDISQLSSGNYFMVISGKDYTIKGKFIVE